MEIVNPLHKKIIFSLHTQNFTLMWALSLRRLQEAIQNPKYSFTGKQFSLQHDQKSF